MQQPTTVSVGPYSLMIRILGHWACHGIASLHNRASPPTINALVKACSLLVPPIPPGGGGWRGVSLTRLSSRCLANNVKMGGGPEVFGSRSFLIPASKGGNKAVTVRSKLRDECMGTAAPPA